MRVPASSAAQGVLAPTVTRRSVTSRPTGSGSGKDGRFHIGGSFDFRIPGASAKVVYRIRGRVRARSGVVTGVASVRASFPNATTGKTIICATSRRAFRARSPVSRAPRHSRGPFYGVTSQGLPIVIRLAPDGSALAPAALWARLSCNIAGPVEATVRLRVPVTAPGAFAVATAVSESFIPALGSSTPIPAGTYTYDPLGFQAQVGGGRATGSIGVSGRVGNAGKILVDTCAAPPIAFTALP